LFLRGAQGLRSGVSARMVNGGFLAEALYGFKIVDTAAQQLKTGINRKFTSRPIVRFFRKSSAN
jgi:hypothetical protein